LLITDYYNEVHPRIPKSYVKNVFSSGNSNTATIRNNAIQFFDLPSSPEQRPAISSQ
jgi:hypothetical protein